MAEEKITVCSACLQASCWHGEFYCDEYRNAGTVEKTRAELETLGREHRSYWESKEGIGRSAKLKNHLSVSKQK